MPMLAALLLLPVAAALVSALPSRRGRLPGLATIFASGAELLLAGEAARRVLADHRLTAFGGMVRIDGLGALLLLLVVFVAFIASLFSYGYLVLHHGDPVRPKRIRAYFALYNLFVLSMIAVPLLSQLALVWIAVEMTTLMSAYLVAYADTPEALEAAWKYVMLTSLGAILGLFGFLLLFWGERSAGKFPFTWQGLLQAAPHMPPAVLWFGFLFSLVGFGAKVGLVPLHTWLPDAHSQAPAPVCALLSGVETTTVLYILLRLFPVLEAGHGTNPALWFSVAGLVSVGVAAFLLIDTHDYKRMFAFSTVEHMGIMMVAVGLGGLPAHFALVYQMTSHALTKSVCFFAAGSVLLVTGTQELDKVRGLIRRAPGTALALLAGGFGIAGAPPFAVFVSEFFIFRAGLETGHYVVVGLLALFVVMAFCALAFHVTRMVFGSGGETTCVHKPPALCQWAIVLGIVPMLVLGLYLPAPIHSLFVAAAHALGR